MVGTENEIAKCAQCGAEFESKRLVFDGQVRFKGIYCQPCCDRRDATDNAVKRSWFERNCPPLYQNTDLNRLAGGWVQKVTHWAQADKGLVVIGPTGIGKTRSVWCLLQRLSTSMRVVVTDSLRFRASMAKAAREGEQELWIYSMSRVDLLFFDDLGQMHMTDAAEEALLAVFEARFANKKPLIATTQYTGPAFVSQFTRQDIGQAIRRRLKEFCEIVGPKLTETTEIN